MVGPQTTPSTDSVGGPAHAGLMIGRYDPGYEPDRPDYRHLRPPLLCEVQRWVDGTPVWCLILLRVWARRRFGEVSGPDGWWGYGEWTLPSGEQARGWAHESELRRRKRTTMWTQDSPASRPT